jgi:hypothetical protein
MCLSMRGPNLLVERATQIRRFSTGRKRSCRRATLYGTTDTPDDDAPSRRPPGQPVLVARHKTALTRYDLSKPVKSLLEYGIQSITVPPLS